MVIRFIYSLCFLMCLRSFSQDHIPVQLDHLDHCQSHKICLNSPAAGAPKMYCNISLISDVPLKPMEYQQIPEMWRSSFTLALGLKITTWKKAMQV